MLPTVRFIRPAQLLTRRLHIKGKSRRIPDTIVISPIKEVLNPGQVSLEIRFKVSKDIPEVHCLVYSLYCRAGATREGGRVTLRSVFMERTPSGKSRLVMEEINQQEEAVGWARFEPQAKQTVDKL